MRKVYLLLLAVLIHFVSCKQVEQPIYQLSTIETLLAGNYDGQKHVEYLKSHGNFGIGTFDKLDGEMIFYKGEIFKAQSNGTVCDAKENETTPYATVCWFQPSIEFSIAHFSTIIELDSIIKKQLPNDSYIYAIEVTGMFDSISVRSVNKQEKPYKPLIEIVKTQAIFSNYSIPGALIGFYSPSTVKEIMVKGMHLHFLSEDMKKAGHLLKVSSNKNVHCRIAVYSGMQLDLCKVKKYSTDSKQMQADIEKVEK